MARPVASSLFSSDPVAAGSQLLCSRALVNAAVCELEPAVGPIAVPAVALHQLALSRARARTRLRFLAVAPGRRGRALLDRAMPMELIGGKRRRPGSIWSRAPTRARLLPRRETPPAPVRARARLPGRALSSAAMNTIFGLDLATVESFASSSSLVPASASRPWLAGNTPAAAPSKPLIPFAGVVGPAIAAPLPAAVAPFLVCSLRDRSLPASPVTRSFVAPVSLRLRRGQSVLFIALTPRQTPL